MTMKTMIGTALQVQSIKVDFLVVATHSNTYSAILGWTSLNKLGVIVSHVILVNEIPFKKRVKKIIILAKIHHKTLKLTLIIHLCSHFIKFYGFL